jgi:hypothetical protein
MFTKRTPDEKINSGLMLWKAQGKPVHVNRFSDERFGAGWNRRRFYGHVTDGSKTPELNIELPAAGKMPSKELDDISFGALG